MTFCWLLGHVFGVVQTGRVWCGSHVAARYTIVACVCCGKRRVGGAR